MGIRNNDLWERITLCCELSITVQWKNQIKRKHNINTTISSIQCCSTIFDVSVIYFLIFLQIESLPNRLVMRNDIIVATLVKLWKQRYAIEWNPQKHVNSHDYQLIYNQTLAQHLLKNTIYMFPKDSCCDSYLLLTS